MGTGITAGVGLLFALVIGMLLVPQASALQDLGEVQTGALNSFFTSVTPLLVIIFVAIVGFGTLAAFAGKLTGK